mmetsp:Transcript_43788/g.115664  ORF Transcript_43788/g.115664 Transcript_43788/m.115664 type:complete len:88 (-) Transcript_43788:32-295(-)
MGRLRFMPSSSFDFRFHLGQQTPRSREEISVCRAAVGHLHKSEGHGHRHETYAEDDDKERHLAYRQGASRSFGTFSSRALHCLVHSV